MFKIVTKKTLLNGDQKTKISRPFLDYKMCNDILSVLFKNGECDEGEILFVPDGQWLDTLKSICSEARRVSNIMDVDIKTWIGLERMLEYMTHENNNVKRAWLHRELLEIAKDYPPYGNNFLAAARALVDDND